MTPFAVHCAPWQAVAVWNQLCDARAGIASHGCTAEVYAYTLGCQSPSAEKDSEAWNATGTHRDAVEARSTAAASDLATICDAFARHYRATVTIDSRYGWSQPRVWLMSLLNERGIYDHRVKIHIATEPE